MSAGSGTSAVELPPRLRRAIEPERTRLGHATAVLNCLIVAAMYDKSIDASAVAKSLAVLSARLSIGSIPWNGRISAVSNFEGGR